jgi:hypothetical protein
LLKGDIITLLPQGVGAHARAKLGDFTQQDGHAEAQVLIMHCVNGGVEIAPTGIQLPDEDTP